MGLPQLVVIDAVDHGQVLVRARGRDQHPLGAGVQVLLGVGTLGEDAGAFHHHVDVEGAPRQVGRVALGEHLDRLAADRDRGLVDPDGGVERAVGRIAAQQMGVHLGRAEVVDGDECDVVALGLERRA